MTKEAIKENIEDIKFRNFINRLKAKALADCAVAYVNNEIRKNIILANGL